MATHTSQELESCRVKLVDRGVDVQRRSALLAIQAVALLVVRHTSIVQYLACQTSVKDLEVTTITQYLCTMFEDQSCCSLDAHHLDHACGCHMRRSLAPAVPHVDDARGSRVSGFFAFRLELPSTNRVLRQTLPVTAVSICRVTSPEPQGLSIAQCARPRPWNPRRNDCASSSRSRWTRQTPNT